MKISLVRFWAISFASSTLVACAIGSSELPVDSAYTPLSFCEARAAAECAPEVVKHCGVGKREDCLRARTEDCVGRAPQAARVRGTIAKSCVTRTSAAYVDAKLTTDELRAVAEECDSAWSGTGEVKAACTVDSDCDTDAGLRCITPLGRPDEVKGTCLRPHRVLAGDSCSGPADVCDPDSYCDSQSSTCVVRRIEGQGCHEWLAPCVAGLTCPGSTMPFSSAKCTPRRAAGTACSKDSECADDICLRVAKTTDGTCVAEVTLTPIDSICATFK